MVDSSIIAGGAVVFVILLAIILYGSRGTEASAKARRERRPKSDKKDTTKNEKKPKQKTGRKNAAPEPNVQVKSKSSVVAERRQEERELQEFLKGADKAEIAKTLRSEERRNAKKGTQQQEAPEIGRSEQISQKEASTFQDVIKPKKEKKAKKDEDKEERLDEDGNPIPQAKKEGKKKKGKKAKDENGNEYYFRSELEAVEKEEKEKKEAEKKAYEDRKAKREERAAAEADRARRIAAGEDVPELPKERKPRRERKEGEERPRRFRQAEDGNGGEEENERKRGPKVPTFDEVQASTSKYQAADINDLLDMFSAGPARGSQKSGGAEPKDQ